MTGFAHVLKANPKGVNQWTKGTGGAKPKDTNTATGKNSTTAVTTTTADGVKDTFHKLSPDAAFDSHKDKATAMKRMGYPNLAEHGGKSYLGNEDGDLKPIHATRLDDIISDLGKKGVDARKVKGGKNYYVRIAGKATAKKGDNEVETIDYEVGNFVSVNSLARQESVRAAFGG